MNFLSTSILKEVIDRNTDLANKLLVSGTVLANNLLLAVTPPGPCLDPSRTLLGTLMEPYMNYLIT